MSKKGKLTKEESFEFELYWLILRKLEADTPSRWSLVKATFLFLSRLELISLFTDYFIHGDCSNNKTDILTAMSCFKQETLTFSFYLKKQQWITMKNALI